MTSGLCVVWVLIFYIPCSFSITISSSALGYGSLVVDDHGAVILVMICKGWQVPSMSCPRTVVKQVERLAVCLLVS